MTSPGGHRLAERLIGLDRFEQACAAPPPGESKNGCACPARSTRVTGSSQRLGERLGVGLREKCGTRCSAPPPATSRRATRRRDPQLLATGPTSLGRTRSTSRVPPYCRPSCRQTPRGRAPAPLPATGSSRARSSSLFLSTHPSHGDEPPALRWGETGGSSVRRPPIGQPPSRRGHPLLNPDATPAARRRPWSSGPATEVAHDSARIADDAMDDSLLQWWNADPRPPWRVVRRGSPPSPLFRGGGPRLSERVTLTGGAGRHSFRTPTGSASWE